jgi:eukaryotic-like serine/threonine-protein kinase
MDARRRSASGAAARSSALAGVGCYGAAAVLAAVVLALWPRPTGPAAEVTRFSVLPAPGTNFPPASNATVSAAQLALSPDGRALVFVAAQRNDRPVLWLRSMDDTEPRPIAGSEGASYPFWSPDNKWIGFLADGKIKKVLAAGGPAQVISESENNLSGATWGPQDIILLGNPIGPIKKVSASGGPIEDVTALQPDRKEVNHRWPQFLPDGRHFLYVVRSSLPGQPGVYLGSLDDRAKKQLIQSDWIAMYAEGHLLYMEANILMARRFDVSSLQVTGDPVVVAERVGSSTAGFAAFSASHTGQLAYGAPTIDVGKLTWMERSGKPGATVGGEAGYIDFRLSPDESRLAVAIVDQAVGTPDVWLTDLTRENASSRLTSNSWTDAGPVWSPDGTRIAFQSNRSGGNDIFVVTAGGGGVEQPLLPEVLRDRGRRSPTDWSPTGHIIYSENNPKTGSDLWLLDLVARKPVHYLTPASDQMHGSFSPDGRFVAYSSNEDGRFEVYVQTFPLSDQKWKVSVSGGFEPHWRADGRELFFLSEDLMLMSASTTTVPTFQPGTPERLFQTQVPEGVSPFRTRYQVSKDGKRFLVYTQTNRNARPAITTVLNWTAALQR